MCLVYFESYALSVIYLLSQANIICNYYKNYLHALLNNIFVQLLGKVNI